MFLIISLVRISGGLKVCCFSFLSDQICQARYPMEFQTPEKAPRGRVVSEFLVSFNKVSKFDVWPQ